MNIFTLNLPVCNSGQYTYVMGLCNFFFVLQDLIERIDSYFQRIAFQRNLHLHSFKEGFILLCQSILETRRITHLLGSAHFTIPLTTFTKTYNPGHCFQKSKFYSSANNILSRSLKNAFEDKDIFLTTHQAPNLRCLAWVI